MRKTLISLLLIIAIAALCMGCEKMKFNAQEQAAFNIATTWAAADSDSDGSMSHSELVAASLRTLNEIAKAFPDKVKWEGRMKTEAGRIEFIEALIALYLQYTAPVDGQ